MDELTHLVDLARVAAGISVIAAVVAVVAAAKVLRSRRK